MRNPKILLLAIALFLTGSGLLGWKIWSGDTMDLSWFKGTASEIQTGIVLDKFATNNRSASGEEKLTTAKPVSLYDSMAVSPINGSRNGSVLFYDRSNGRVLEAFAPDSSTHPVTEQSLPGFVSSVWSPNKKTVISLFATDQGVQFKFYNFATKETATLPLNTKSVVFSPDSNQIAFFVTTGDVGGVYLAFPDGSNRKKILETRITDLELYWPSGDRLFFLAKNPNTRTFDLVRIHENGRLENILTDKKDLAVLLSKDGSRVVFSFITPEALHTGYKAIDSVSEQLLAITTTADSCAWSIDNDSLYCGVPEKDSTSDNVYRVSIAKNTATLLYKSSAKDESVKLQSPFLSPLEDYLFFINSLDGHLYGLHLE